MPDSVTLLRRLAPALAVTGAATALVMSFDPALGSAGSAAAPAATAPATAGPQASGPADSEAPASQESGTGSTSGSTSGSGSAAPPENSASGSATCTGTLLTGPTVYTRWGPVQVAATVSSGGTVCSSSAIQHPDGDTRSQMINARALPVIAARVAESGDASFDAVSGATVTSEGYRRSLQALLDQA